MDDDSFANEVGTNKTEMCSSESDDDDPYRDRLTRAPPRFSVLVPTRELAAQVALEARRLLFGTGRTVALLHGGQSVKPQLEQLAFAPMVVVSTPGRLLTCAADEGYVSLEEVKTLILDEADQMVDMGFAPQVAEICRGEACGVPPPAPLVSPHASFAGGAARDFRVGRQTLLFSHLPPAVRRLARWTSRWAARDRRAAARARLGRPRREHRRRNRAEPGALREQPARKSSPCSWRRSRGWRRRRKGARQSRG